MQKFLIGSLVIAVLIIGIFIFDSQQKDIQQEEPITLYCAAGMKAPVIEIAAAYENNYNIPIQIQYGGSGQLLSNLRVSQSGDLYIAGDDSYVQKAKQDGLVAESIPLATMKPVIAFAKGNPKSIESYQDLLRQDVSVALGNPDAAAVGRIAKRLLQQGQIWDTIESRVKVFKPTVNEIANDIKIGSVDVGIIWDTIANQYPAIDMLEMPAWSHAAQDVTIGVLAGSQQPTAALRFARYLGARDKGLVAFQKHGFTPVEGDVWAEVPEITFFSGGVNRMAIQDTIKEFEAREGCEINVVYNGCGILVGQMKTGTIPDAYFSCDVSFMTEVADMFMDSIHISETDMVIVVPKENPHGIKTPTDLTQKGLKIGVANAEQSALGSLTKRLLTEMQLADAIYNNVVSQTPTADLLVNQLLTGSLDAVIVYEANTSQIREKTQILAIDHPQAKAIQPFAIEKGTDHAYLLKRFLATIQSKDSLNQFKEVGFRVYDN
ncbi:molybdate ABC transporter substrate-binding protein [bacterium]|nr:molybdate ABC transporter substrate-binding protein [bacterium]